MSDAWRAYDGTEDLDGGSDVTELADAEDERFESETFTETVTTENSLMSSIQELISQTVNDENIEEQVITTENSLMSSIQELISQTVNDENIEEQVISLNANQKVEDVLTEMGEKPMQNIQNKAATIGSMLIGDESIVNQEVNSESADETLNLYEAGSSVLSQIYPESEATTIEDATTTEVVTELDSSVLSQIYPESEATTIEDATRTEVGSVLSQIYPESEATTIEDATTTEVVTELEKIQEEVTKKSAIAVDLKEVTEEDLKNNETSSEENITDESSQTVVTEIDTNQSELSSVASELNSTDALIQISQNKDEVTEQEDDLIKIAVIHPVEEKIAESDKKDELMTELDKVDQDQPGYGLEDTTSKLDTDIYQFVELCNELSFGFWTSTNSSNYATNYRSDFGTPSLTANCGEAPINPEQHHSEIYPATSRRPYRRAKKLGHYVSDSVFGDITDEPRDYQRAFHDPLHDPNLLALPLPLRPRQARIPDAPRLRFDRPFLFYVRHNPTGLILHMGRFNPRLLP
ncbi:hypothetical protein QE152_g16894 [Popillia japonica]|uniref:Uncharacterized protein n=1 Tax=Popillia japonica TaxID=7064 RepID=A0AAW1L5T5_POPJA